MFFGFTTSRRWRIRSIIAEIGELRKYICIGEAGLGRRRAANRCDYFAVVFALGHGSFFGGDHVERERNRDYDATSIHNPLVKLHKRYAQEARSGANALSAESLYTRTTKYRLATDTFYGTQLLPELHTAHLQQGVGFDRQLTVNWSAGLTPFQYFGGGTAIATAWMEPYSTQVSSADLPTYHAQYASYDAQAFQFDAPPAP